MSDASPRLGAFNTLTVSTLDTSPNDPSNCLSTPHFFSQPYSSPGSSFISPSFGPVTNESARRQSMASQEGLAISPLLTLSATNVTSDPRGVSHQMLSGGGADNLGNHGNATRCGLRQVRQSRRRTKSSQSVTGPQGYSVGERNHASPHQMTTDAGMEVDDDGLGGGEMEAGVSSVK
jgi:hypothetical protein